MSANNNCIIGICAYCSKDMNGVEIPMGVVAEDSLGEVLVDCSIILLENPKPP